MPNPVATITPIILSPLKYINPIVTHILSQMVTLVKTYILCNLMYYAKYYAICQKMSKYRHLYKTIHSQNLFGIG